MAKFFRSTITTTGPFFTRDPSKTLAENIHTMMLAVAREGAKDVKGQLRAGTTGRAPVSELGGRVADRIAGELRRWPPGPRYTARVIVKNRRMSRDQGIALMAAASFLEGTTGAFRRTRARLLRSRAINNAELTRGMN